MSDSFSNLACIRSERAFAGCVVSSHGDALHAVEARSAHFTDPLASTVFGAAVALFNGGGKISVGTVSHRIGRERIDELGGFETVAHCCHYLTPEDAPHFFEILEGKRALREARHVALWAANAACSVEDPRAFCVEFQSKTAAIEASAESENVLPTVCDAITAKLDRIEAGVCRAGFPSPVKAWNDGFGGILDGQLYAVAGRPGTGKTCLMEMKIQAYLEADIPVTVFEKDMSPQKLLERMACRRTGVPFWKFAREKLSPMEARALRGSIDIYRELPFNLYNPNGLTAERMCAIARRDIRTRGTKAVFLDHVQALRVGRELREGLTQASLCIRQCVTETGIPHVVLAHLNREGAKGRPRAEDIKEFDQLYGDCDGMLLLWTDCDRTALAGADMPVKFSIAKNRDGDLSESDVKFNGEYLKFLNV